MRPPSSEAAAPYASHREAILSALRASRFGESEPIRRVLLIDCWPGAPGQKHIQAIEHALQRRRVAARTLTFDRYQIEAQGDAYRRFIEPQLLKALHAFQPHLVVSYGYHGSQLVRDDLFHAAPARWLQMVSNICYYNTQYYENEHTGLIEENLIPLFRKRGAPHPFFIPLMADYVLPQPVATSRNLPILFVGNSLALAPAEREALLAGWRDRPALCRYVQESLASLSRVECPTNMYQLLREHPIPQIETLEEEYAVFRFLLCEASAARRCRVLELLVPFGLALFGGDWSNALTPESPLLGCLRGRLPIDKDRDAFSHGSVFINIHSIGHVTGANMRFFNAAGMGAFQISDNPNLSRYLEPDKEIVFFTHEKDCVEKVRYYLAHPNEMDVVRAQAQERIRREWSYDRWAEWIAEPMGIRW